MAISEAKKKANQKWDSANMATMACKVKREQAEQFRAYCTNRGETVNAVLQGFVSSCINGTASEARNIAPDGDKNAGAILTPAALKTAQEAAQMAGESIPAFVTRAVETQAQRDKVMQAMRPREKAPDKSET